MATKTKQVTKELAEELPVPQSDQEADDLIARIAELDVERDGVLAKLNADTALLKKNAEESISHKTAEISRLAKGLNIYFKANQERLTEDGKRRSHRFARGDIGLRMGRASVKLVNTKRIILHCLRKPMLRRIFLRIKFEVNKQAILAHQDLASNIKGIKLVEPQDYFFVRPLSLNLDFDLAGQKLLQAKDKKEGKQKK